MKRITKKKAVKNTSNNKTIIVVYTNIKLTAKEIAGAKKYSFNADASKVKIGDLFQSDDYSTPMQVVRIMHKKFKYVNTVTGEMSDVLNSTKQFEIRDFVVVSKTKGDNVVFVEKL